MPGLYVEFIEGTFQDGEVRKLVGPNHVGGRSKECSIRLRTDAASRKHAVLKLEGATWIIQDLESRNGTFLNGKQVKRARLAPHDQVAFGPEAAVRIVSMDPAPPPRAEGRIPTARPLVERRRADRPAPPPARPRASPPAPTAPSPPRRRLRPLGVILPLMGIAFGILTASGLWDRVLPSFPYVPALAPIVWALTGAARLAPDLLVDAGEWPARGLAALYYGTVGLALARPMRRWFLLFLLCIVHLAAILGVYDVVF